MIHFSDIAIQVLKLGQSEAGELWPKLPPEQHVRLMREFSTFLTQRVRDAYMRERFGRMKQRGGD